MTGTACVAVLSMMMDEFHKRNSRSQSTRDIIISLIAFYFVLWPFAEFLEPCTPWRGFFPDEVINTTCTTFNYADDISLGPLYVHEQFFTWQREVFETVL
jgi:hypothetical protein